MLRRGVCCTIRRVSESDVEVLIAVTFPEPLLERLRAVSPRLRVHHHPSRSFQELPEGLLSEVEVLYTSRRLPDPDVVPELRWIQFHTAGVDRQASHPLVNSESVIVTTMSGASAPQMAEFVLLSILALGRRLLLMLEDQRSRRWAQDRFDRFTPTDLRGSTVGIVGYGSIGRETARLCRAFGAEVLATKRDLMRIEDEGYHLDGLGDARADLVDRLYPPQALGSMVSLCDFLVVTVPLTSETRGMLHEGIFKKMKPGAYLIDVSRGGVVDHSALVEALQDKRIAGAALDVYPVEPLPETSLLWDMPNVILSPHVAGSSKYYFERAAGLFSANLHRFLTEQPLLNRYHPDRGY